MCTGAAYEYEGVTFTIWQRIVGTEQSDYEGLYGFIVGIRDGKDKETENDTPDIYCRFDSPVLPCDVTRLEETEKGCIVFPIYAVIQDWTVRGERGHNVEILYHSDRGKKTGCTGGFYQSAEYKPVIVFLIYRKDK